jgi:hypothetical protein
VPGGWSGSGRLEIGKICYFETRRIRIRTHTTPARIRAVRMLGGGAHRGRRVRRVSGRFEYIIQRLRPRSACTLLKQLRGALRLLSLSHAVSEAMPPPFASRKYIKRLRFGGVPSVPAPHTLAFETSVPVPCLHPPTPTHPPTRPPTQSMAWRSWFYLRVASFVQARSAGPSLINGVCVYIHAYTYICTYMHIYIYIVIIYICINII